MNIIKKIKELNLPSDQYVIVSSSVLDVLGIRKALDIDIAVTKDLFNKMRETGEWEEVEKYNKIFLKKEDFDIIPQLNWENYNTTIEEAIASAFIIDGVPFMNLNELIKFKTALGREKDFKDIELIKKYQENHYKNIYEGLIKIVEMDDSLVDSLKEIADEATKAGSNFVQKTIDEWKNGKNTFSKPGEKLWSISINNEIVALGGLNKDPYIDNDNIGRVRHVYVSEKYRGQGLSKVLLKIIIDEAKKHFKILRLSTNNPIAASLYESFGFEKTDQHKATHIIKDLETYSKV